MSDCWHMPIQRKAARAWRSVSNHSSMVRPIWLTYDHDTWLSSASTIRVAGWYILMRCQGGRHMLADQFALQSCLPVVLHVQASDCE